MQEGPHDLEDLQELLDRSYAGAGEHLQSIHEPRWRLTAEEVVENLQGMVLLVLATSTRDGRPLTGAVDGFFVRGKFCFGSSPDSLRFRHLRERPDVSATHLPGEHLGITVHGKARVIDFEDDEDALGPAMRQACLEQYGEGWLEWGSDAAYAVIEPVKMFTFHLDESAMTPEEAAMRG